MLENKKILVTGGLGFIGSHFVELLLDKCSDCIIDIIDIKDYCVSNKTEDLLIDKAGNTTNHLDIVQDSIVDCELSESYDYIVNFAAQSHVDRSIEDGNDFVMTNVVGTHNLLNQFNGTRFVQIGTDEVYGSLSYNEKPSLEKDLLKPSSVYSSSKASADLIALSFHTTHKKDVIVTRCCNNFGPRQYPEKLIPVVINKLISEEKVPVYGDGTNTRQWIFVKDHCQQVYDAMLYGTAGEIYNVEPIYNKNSEINNNNIVHEIISSVKLNKNYDDHIKYVEDRKGHDFRYSLNGKKLKYLVNRSRQHQYELPYLEKTIERDLDYTIMWYKKNKNWWDENITD